MSDEPLILTEGMYLYIQRGDEIVMALQNDNKALRSFVTVMSPKFRGNEMLTIAEGNSPADEERSYFGGKLLIGGTPIQASRIAEIQVKTIQQ